MAIIQTPTVVQKAIDDLIASLFVNEPQRRYVTNDLRDWYVM
jgi:hypothetical protein